jgi:hypothetical protein
MALSGDPTSGDPVRDEKVNLWRELSIDVDPKKARVAQFDGVGTEFVAVLEISHDGRTWRLGIDEDRTAECVDGPRLLPEWVDELAFHLGIDEVVRDA